MRCNLLLLSKNLDFGESFWLLSFLLPFWLVLLFLLYYSKSHPETKTALNSILYLFGLVLTILLSDNLHKIIAPKRQLIFREDSIQLISNQLIIIDYKDLVSVDFKLQRYDNKLWIFLKWNKNKSIDLQIIDNWYLTPFLTKQSRKNFLRLLSVIAENQSLQQFVDNSSIDLVKQNLQL